MKTELSKQAKKIAKKLVNAKGGKQEELRRKLNEVLFKIQQVKLKK